MKSRLRPLILIALLLPSASSGTVPSLRLPLLVGSSAHAQLFGKNKVTYKRFNWFLHKTEHFDIYYYPSEADLVPEAGRILEEAYERLSDALNHQLRDRTPLILYKSHTDFRQTNVTLEELTEGVGGFAEIFKHRIVIPFTGSRRELRRVLFHELTHIFQYDIIYQKPIAHIFTGEFLYSPPLWFIEGMAEYFSGEMDSVGEMVLRTAVVANKLVPLKKLQDFSALGPFVYLGYKEGQSAVQFLASEFGEEKIASLLQELRHSRTKDLDEAMKNALGIGLEEFDRRWQRELRKRYYPLVASRDMPDVVAKRLTKAGKGSYLKPAWSPSGDMIAVISTVGGQYDVRVISAEDGRTVLRPIARLYRREFEEIRTKGTGVAWSPEGDRLAFFASKDARDYLFIYDVVADRYLKIEMPFDMCWSPEWSPDGGRIAFVALKDGRSDIYILSLGRVGIDKPSIRRVTDDPFDEESISWNPKSEELAFSSERGGWYRIVVRDLVTGRERVFTPAGFDSRFPRWSSDGRFIYFTADIGGFNDVYRLDVRGGRCYRVVKTLTGCFSPAPSPDGGRLAFSAYSDGVQDIYLVELSGAELEEVELKGEEPLPEEERPELKLVSRRRYTPKLMLDAIFTDFVMSSDGILRNVTQLVASDMLGNHRLMLTVLSQSGYFAPDFIAYYFYLAMKPDFGVALYNYHTFHLVRAPWGEEWFLERNTGVAALLSHPLSRYRRIELQLEAISMPFSYSFRTRKPIQRGNIIYLSASVVGDTVEWSEFGPRSGSRYILAAERTLPWLGSELDMTNLTADLRGYIPLGERTVLAVRAIGAASFGRDSMVYYLGGIDTLRGYGYEELSGSRALLLNFELRVPFIDEIRFGWPIPWSLSGIRGVGFIDMGAAWWRWERPVFWRVEGRRVRLKDLKCSVGVGLRLKLGLFDLDFAFARRTDLTGFEPGHTFHFGIGQEF